MTGTLPLRITLVDDSDLANAGLRTLLAPYADRVAVVDNRDALAAPDSLDVVLYEPMGQTSMSRSLLRDLQSMSAAQAAVFSWAGPDQLPATPANPHLAKSLTASQLVVSVERLVEGRFETAPVSRRVVLAPVAEEPVEEEPTPEIEPETHFEHEDVGLTPRESEIVSLIVSGLSNREIGDRLQLSINSVKTYIRSAYRKMGVERRTQAVLWGLDNGIHVDRGHALVG
ncbi:helix-turn-helix transcriptional regulator [Nocardioides rubriscoriae]|uniref:helix-turn-helix transcriptional regulator n=1 Tax=Nocardioides rubriscoriae TaxID=642762 RepID=UPI0011DF78C0|nr:response regulator transcription factor [Nocardioides rubriscoriae]